MKNKPHQVEIEPVRGCNKTCWFCPVRIMPKDKEFITLDLAKKISIDLIAFDPIRINLSGRGEPTLHPELIEIVRTIRKYNTRSQITVFSNGIKLNRDLAIELFRAGANILAVDCYGNTLPKYRERFEGLPMVYNERSKYSPWTRNPPRFKMIIFLEDIDGTADTKRIISTRCNQLDFDVAEKHGVKPFEGRLKKRCLYPFRNMTVYANGDISACCYDFFGGMVYANVKEIGIREAWENHPKINALRKMLYNRDREIASCSVCDFHGGYRQGIIEDYGGLNRDEKRKCIEIWNGK